MYSQKISRQFLERFFVLFPGSEKIRVHWNTNFGESNKQQNGRNYAWSLGWLGKYFMIPEDQLKKKPSNKTDQPLESTQKQPLTLRCPTSHQQSTNKAPNARHFPNHHKAPVHSVAMSRGTQQQKSSPRPETRPSVASNSKKDTAFSALGRMFLLHQPWVRGCFKSELLKKWRRMMSDLGTSEGWFVVMSFYPCIFGCDKK